MLKNNPLALILMGLAGILLALVVAQMSGWGRHPEAMPPVPADLSGLPALNQEAALAVQGQPPLELEKITAQPLFSPDRKPEAIEALAENTGENEELPVKELKARVTSIVITPENRYAIIYDETSKQRLTLEPGMPLEGDQGAWVVTSIAPRLVKLSAGEDKTAELELDVFASALPATAAPVSRPRNAAGKKPPQGRIRNSGDTTKPKNISAAEIRRKIAERRAQLRAEAAKRNNK